MSDLTDRNDAMWNAGWAMHGDDYSTHTAFGGEDFGAATLQSAGWTKRGGVYRKPLGPHLRMRLEKGPFPGYRGKGFSVSWRVEEHPSGRGSWREFVHGFAPSFSEGARRADHRGRQLAALYKMQTDAPGAAFGGEGFGGPNKYLYLHVVQADYGYGHGWEDVAASESFREARADLRTYRREDAHAQRLRMIERREPNPKYRGAFGGRDYAYYVEQGASMAGVLGPGERG